ncbi:hypothetical protein [Bartonella bacilliformis]|uniref:hypothetical protein n=1 Tax=Bartonella bacilliformis TaxID=774 RepID=UPI0005A42254|nr:hypothetical protein [Bartonella bacilliformis]
MQEKLNELLELVKKFFTRKKFSEDAKVGMEQIEEELAIGLLTVLCSLTHLADFFQSLSHHIKEWIGMVDL